MNCPPTLHHVVPALSAALSLGLTCATWAQHETQWTSTDGVFTDPANWSDGAPAADSTAVFDVLGGLDVTFSASALSNRLFVRSGAVNFLLNGFSLDLLSPSVWAHGLVVAEADGDFASLNVLDGEVNAAFALIGDSLESYGTLRVENATINVTGHAFVGLGGSGTLELAEQSEMTAGALTVGSLSGSTGELLVAEGSRLELAGPMRLAQVAGSQGHALVQGDDAQVEIFGHVDVGIRDDGIIEVVDGAEMIVHGSIYAAGPGGLPSQRAKIVVQGEGSLLLVHGDLWLGPENAPGPCAWKAKLSLEDAGRTVVNGALGETACWGVIEIRISSGDSYANHAALAIGSATSIPEINVVLADGFVPSPGDLFRIIEHPEALLTLPPLPQPLQWQIVESQEWVGVVANVPSAADLNGDGIVNVFDLLILLVNWGACPEEAGCVGDINFDGVVNVFDLLLLLLSWG